MFNPDVAELIRPFLTIEIFKIAKNQGVDKVILENKPVRKNLDTDALRDLEDEALPDNTFNIEFTPEEEELMKIPSEPEQFPEPEGFMTKPREVA
jgi:pyridoxine 5'-phosphate synthase PdxJ